MKLTTTLFAACHFLLGVSLHDNTCKNQTPTNTIQVSAVPTGELTLENGLKPGYTEFVPEWEVELHPGGPMVKVRGTIEQVRAEMIRRNPDFETHYPINQTAIDERVSSLTKRTDWTTSTYSCGNWGPAKISSIREGISYLYGLNGRPTNGAGPNACGRVSCSWNSGIWWCNNVSHASSLPLLGPCPSN
jgi:hypothetical protein